MWSSTGDVGGGFLNTSLQSASPAPKKEKRVQNVVPVTIKSIIDCHEESFTLSGHEVHIVVVFGIVKSVDSGSAKVTYVVNDGTGSIDAVQWIDGDLPSTDSSNIMEGTYVRVVGSVRMQKEMRQLMVYHMAPVENPNRITTHLLEVIHAGMKLDKVKEMEQGSFGAVPAGGIGGLENSFVSGGGGVGTFGGAGGIGMGPTHGLTGSHKMVYQVIKMRPADDPAGASKDQIIAALKGKHNESAICQSLEFLTSEGHVYSTIDDDHFKVTDS